MPYKIKFLSKRSTCCSEVIKDSLALKLLSEDRVVIVDDSGPKKENSCSCQFGLIHSVSVQFIFTTLSLFSPGGSHNIANLNFHDLITLPNNPGWLVYNAICNLE